jgi:hypothetical protein
MAWASATMLVLHAGARPRPTASPTDPKPAGPRTVGRPYTRHLARKLEAPDGQNTGGTHTRNPPPIESLRVQCACMKTLTTY